MKQSQTSNEEWIHNNIEPLEQLSIHRTHVLYTHLYKVLHACCLCSHKSPDPDLSQECHKSEPSQVHWWIGLQPEVHTVSN